MKTFLPGYELVAPLYEGSKTIIYQGHRESEPISVIIKTLKSEYPNLEEISRLRHEYQILNSLELPGIIKPLELKLYQHGFALILEDFNGQPLKQYITEQTLSLVKFLEIGIQLAQTLSELHKNQVIHKDIKPQNILIYLPTGQIKIIDFSIATRLEKENPTLSNPNYIEGTLAYMSPEQTGRMNRSIDYRTDFYSLGITFYEMLVGQLPFTSNEPMELVHCHIAKNPVPPHQINPQIPKAISSIIMKLIAKTAEERYQSGQGLKADLEICLHQLQQSGKIDNFVPGQLDRSGQFTIPQKLYGREIEVSTLLAAFERIAVGTTEMILVSGYSGIGKTCVVQEVHKLLVRQQGYFIAGKFDQFKRNIPYAALIQAFQELIRQLLTETPEQIAIWKTELLEAVGQNGRVLIEVIPEIEMIVGTQPEVPQLGATESQNRFNQVFKQFVRVFAKPSHPLVLFLDDLQWADSASLKLIQLIVTDADRESLLLIGAYRDNEVSPTHPTIQTIEEIKKAGATVSDIVLQPLDIVNVQALVADTLQDTTKSRELAELLFNKTQGNPFFLTQLFKTLHSEKLLSFDFSQGNWNWNINQIQSIGIADCTVVDLVARNIQKLPERTQQALKLAACIGNRFNLDVLVIVHEISSRETAADLWPALQVGLILPLSNNYKIPLVLNPEEGQTTLLFDESRIGYKFLHDRVQQAAYSLIPESEKKATHLKIGKLLLEQYTDEQSVEDNVFDIVNQLNIGVEFIIQESEKERLAQLNLMAGHKAKAATAYEAAVKYLNVGLELLPESSWQSHYHLTWNLHLETLEVEYLNTNFERTKHLSEILLSRAKSLLEKVKVYELKIPFYFTQNQPQTALETALEVLNILGVPLPKKINQVTILLEFVRSKFIIGNKRIEALAELPEMTDPYKLTALRILIAVIPAAFNVNPALFPIVIFKMVNFSVKYGNSSLSSYGYGMYGMLLCGVFGDIDRGYQFGQLSLKLLDKFNAKEFKSKVNFLFNAFVRHWKEPTHNTIPSLIEGYVSGIETGDLEYACFSLLYASQNLFWKGEHLESVAKTQAQYLEMMLSSKQSTIYEHLAIWSQFVLNLLNNSEDKALLVGTKFNEEERLPILQEAKSLVAIAYLYLVKTILFYLFKEYERSLDNAKLFEQYKAGLTGVMHMAQHNFYYSLAMMANYRSASKSEKKQYLKQVETHQKQMKGWALHAPMNFQHKYELVEAEKARVLGQPEKAATYYERAIRGAKENGYIHEEAIANELAADFNLALGREKMAKTYMTEAYYSYIRWGAKAKVRDLDTRCPHLISRTLQVEPSTLNPSRTTAANRTTTSTSGHSTILDLAAVMKAAQVVSSEIVLDELLRKLIAILIENAGATRGCLLTKDELTQATSEEWLISAAGSVEGSEIMIELAPPAPTEHSPASLTPSEHPVSRGIINYVVRTRETVVLNDATSEGIFTKDAYIKQHRPKSVLCTPLINQNQLTGLVYLENNLTTGAFTAERLTALQLLSGQAAIALTNAKLYTEISASEKQLRASQSRLIQFLEAVPVGIFITNQDGRPYFANQLAQQILGKGVIPDVTGLQLAETYQAYLAGTEEICPPERNVTLKALNGECSKADDLEIHKGDQIIPIETFGTPVYDEDGKICYTITAFNDITERKKSEAEREQLLQQLSKANQQLAESSQNLEEKVEARTAELKAAQKQIVASEKLASLGALTAGVAHEIRNPLNFVTSLATLSEDIAKNLASEFETLQEHLDPETAELISEDLTYLQRNVSEIYQQGQRANSIIQSMLMHARTDGTARQKTHINALVAQAAQLAYHSIRAKDPDFNINLQIQCDETIGELDVAFSDLSRALINIIDNACYAAHNHPQLMGENFNPTVTVITKNLGEKIEIRIRDNGAGIPQENYEKIFQPFFTTKPPGQGTGLGLSITHDIIVGQHRGNLEVESTHGEYTAFIVTLPNNG